MRRVAFTRLRDRIRSSFWLVPTVCVVVSIVLAVGLVKVDQLIGDVQSAVLFPGPPAGATSFLSSIITSMISVTGLVFSITVVVLVLTSGQFSPRVLRGFLRDRTIQWSLGVFIATFVYAMTVIRDVQGSTDTFSAFVPRIAVTFAFLLVLASVALFIAYINHIANMIRVSSIITRVGDEARALLERRCPADPPRPPPTPQPAAAPAVVVVPSPTLGVIVSVNEADIVERARRDAAVVELVPRVGDFVPAGGPLLRVHGGDDGGRGYADLIALDSDRTMEQDLAFGFRQLVDIAEKALSPGINDPTTACQAIDILHDLLRRLATRELPTGRHPDRDGTVRLIVPQYDFADFLRVAVAEIWHYGADGMQIGPRLETMLRDLQSAALPRHRVAVEHWLAVVTRRYPTGDDQV